jgi:hypothetical protein
MLDEEDDKGALLACEQSSHATVATLRQIDLILEAK